MRVILTSTSAALTSFWVPCHLNPYKPMTHSHVTQEDMGTLAPCPGTHTSQLARSGSRDSAHQSVPLQQAMEGDLLNPTMVQPEGRHREWERLLFTLKSGQRMEHLQTRITRQRKKEKVAGSQVRPGQTPEDKHM